MSTQDALQPRLPEAHSFDEKFRRLTAIWNRGVDPIQTRPSTLTWSDGSPGTIEEFARYEADTQRLFLNHKGEYEQHICPDIIATVEYDDDLKDWIIRGDGLETRALNLRDPNASDDNIASEVCFTPTVYKYNVIRRKPNGKSITS